MEEKYPKCIDCKDEDATIMESTNPDGSHVFLRCRDCDIEYHLTRATCKKCEHFIMRRDLVPDSHEPGCPDGFGPCPLCGGVAEHREKCENELRAGHVPSGWKEKKEACS